MAFIKKVEFELFFWYLRAYQKYIVNDQEKEFISNGLSIEQYFDYHW